MRTIIITLTVLGALAAGGCYRNATQKVNRELRFNDRPARVTCYGYSGVLVDTVSLGAVERDRDEVISFVDSRTGRPVKSEGECVIEHLQAVAPARPELTANLKLTGPE